MNNKQKLLMAATLVKLAAMQPRRELDPEEEEYIAKRKKSLNPKLLSTLGEPAGDAIHNPMLEAILGGLAGAAGGGALGASYDKAQGNDDGRGALTGAATGALGLGGLNYLLQHLQNKDSEEIIRRSPGKATLYDLKANPLSMNQQLSKAMAMSGMAGR